MPTNNSTHSRHLLYRIQTIHNLVDLNRFPNCNTLAERLECNIRTIRRDIGFMRDFLGLPIEYDATARGYHYTAHVSALPTASFNVRETAILNRIIVELRPDEPETAAILQSLVEKLITLGGLQYKKNAA